jgi:hypothetical protein
MAAEYNVIEYRSGLSGGRMYIELVYEKNGKERKPKRYNERALWDDVFNLPCGCTVEPDGECYHGIQSPLLGARLV